MKKIVRILSVVAFAIILVLFIPIPKGSYDDGGTREYEALTYKLVRWNRLTDDGIYHKTRVYWGEEKTHSTDELWQEEALLIKHAFDAIIFEITENTVVVEAMPYEQESGLLSFSSAALDTSGVTPGDVVRVSYVGPIRESSPAQIDVDAWITEVDMSDVPFQGEWMDKSRAYADNNFVFYQPVITAIYADCFFVRTANFYIAKINGTLSEGWCVGDVVDLTCENVYYNETQRRTEADLLTIGAPEDILLSDYTCAKPVIYLYPEETTDVDVTLTLDGELTCTYPAYSEGWHVTAAPDGTLTDEGGQTYNYLYWEGDTTATFDMSRGFCVKGEDTAAFLEEALDKLGLTRREANEFIVYWLPLMQENPYNLIAFQTDAYTDAAKLEITPAPDTLIRVFMTWQASDTFVELPPQPLTAPVRIGFTAVEWGGTHIK